MPESNWRGTLLISLLAAPDRQSIKKDVALTEIIGSLRITLRSMNFSSHIVAPHWPWGGVRGSRAARL